MTRLFAAVGAVGLTVSVAWSGPPSATPTTAELVTKLSSDEYAEREAAVKALQQVGPDALPVLREALKSSDPEVRAYLNHSVMAPLYVPTMVFVDRQGTIRHQYMGGDPYFNNQEKNLRDTIEEMLKQK